MDPSQYRFYPQPLPSEGDLVMVRVTRVTSLGVYVTLLEYNHMEAMITQGELTRRRIRSINKLIKIAQVLCCLVVRVDEKKGYVDLSKRRVSEEEARRCVAKYSRAKTVHSIIIRSADLLNYSTETEVYDFYSKTAWHLNKEAKKKKNGKLQAFDIFCSTLHDPEVLNACNIDEAAKEVLQTTIQTHMQDRRVQIKACISVVCYGPEGVDGVKESLKEGMKHVTEDVPVKICYLNAPFYSVTAENVPEHQKAAALESVTLAISSVEQKINQFQGGAFCVVDKPKVFSHTSHAKHNDDTGDNDDDIEFEDLDYFSGSDDNDDNEGVDDDDDDANKSAKQDYEFGERSEAKDDELWGACGGEDSGIGKDVM